MGLEESKLEAQNEQLDIPVSKKSFDGDLTAENIYKYYLEQTGYEDKANELVDKLINKFDELIEKGKR